MHYTLSYKNPHQHLVDVRFSIPNINAEEIAVQLPAWRPGRYELGNFAQNIKTFQPKDSSGRKLSFQKATKDSWKIQTKGARTVHIEYSYYANELNAGSTFLDDAFLYVNPVNCLLYVPARINEPCELELQIPKNYMVACGLKKISPHKFSAAGYHELADCPFIASASLQKNHYSVERLVFNVWFQGAVQPDWKMLFADFKRFTEAQRQLFGSFPFGEYHFLFLSLPEKFYHGVEHSNSTVIALGPAYGMMSGKGYEDLLGVSSHELFHAWNVKAIRPVEMFPYDYSRENYSRLGYVAEGVTTYYGDLMLLRSGVFTEEQYLKTFNELLEKHFSNFGRMNLSVADSSFDTWLDGYKQGVPGRKSSIYTEGALCAFVLDMLIRRKTGNKKSLDDLMRLLYEEFGKKQKGYSENDYKTAAEKIAGVPLDDFFENYLNGTSSYVPELTSSLDYLGYELQSLKKPLYTENALGLKTQAAGEKTIVSALFPNSPADRAGLSLQDEILAVNGMRVENNLNDWCVHFSKEKKFTLTVSTGKRLREIVLTPDNNLYYLNYAVVRQGKLTPSQKNNWDAWSSAQKMN